MKKKLIIAIVITSLVLLFFLGFIVTIKGGEKVTLTINGEQKVILSINSEYSEPGATAKACSFNKCDDITNNIIVGKKPDTNALGEYKIEYKIEYKGKTYTKERIVSVVDNIPPSITLKGNKSIQICPNEKYEEEGYEALDNYDGDISNKVIVKDSEDGKTYEVVDSSNNSAQEYRKIDKQDTTKPVIKLKGSSTITLYLNDKYIEPGFTVTDNCSKMSSDKVKTSNNIDTSKEGTYNVSYTVKDDSGNVGTANRTVKVKKSIDFDTTDKNEYIENLESYIKQKKYNVSLGYVNLNTGYTYLYNEKVIYYGASLVKTVDALYVYENLDFDEETRKKVEKAISVSDNTAHRQLVDLIGIEKLRAYGRNIGAKNFLTNSNKDYYANTTVKDQIAVWKYLYKFINTNSKGNELKQYFINDYFSYLLFDGIPTTMHKYGYYGSFYHDVGIVYSDSPYIVVILTKHGNGNYEKITQDLSKKIYGLNKIDK